MVIASVAGAIVSVNALEEFCAGDPLSITLNVRGDFVTAVVGVPVITPVEAFRFKPAGSVPLAMDQ